jgi:hypothetical protein
MAQDVRVVATGFRKGVGQFRHPLEGTTTTKYTKHTKKTACFFVSLVLFVVYEDSFPSTRSTTQQPRTCGPGLRLFWNDE